MSGIADCLKSCWHSSEGHSARGGVNNASHDAHTRPGAYGFGSQLAGFLILLESPLRAAVRNLKRYVPAACVLELVGTSGKPPVTRSS